MKKLQIKEKIENILMYPTIKHREQRVIKKYKMQQQYFIDNYSIDELKLLEIYYQKRYMQQKFQQKNIFLLFIIVSIVVSLLGTTIFLFEKLSLILFLNLKTLEEDFISILMLLSLSLLLCILICLLFKFTQVYQNWKQYKLIRYTIDTLTTK